MSSWLLVVGLGKRGHLRREGSETFLEETSGRTQTASVREEYFLTVCCLLRKVKRTNRGSHMLCVAANSRVTLGRDMKNLCLRGPQVISISSG